MIKEKLKTERLTGNTGHSRLKDMVKNNAVLNKFENMMKKEKFEYHQIFNWQTQAKEFPEHGTGIEYFKGVMKNDKWVDCLLYYGRDSKLKGVLYFYPFDFPLERKGNVTLEVKQSERRKGIATALLNEGIKRFQIDLGKQLYTELGRKFIKKYKQHKKYRVS